MGGSSYRGSELPGVDCNFNIKIGRPEIIPCGSFSVTVFFSGKWAHRLVDNTILDECFLEDCSQKFRFLWIAMLCYASCKPEQELTNYLCQYTHFSFGAIFKRRLELVFLYPV